MAKKNERNTKGRIISAAWKLFYEQGYEDTTVEEIVEESRTSKGSFYHYSKERMRFSAPFPTCLMKNTRN
ncbi:helix-turn-helix domain-containing protein [Clostridium sp. AM58-1XD]|uniref:TetR/AcrR family transcriptional regulator n=1 Tax=Clostridium sp. AM58-1XD TaxID=2292307 RepID=UPI0026B894D0